ncbi:unnamed protein product, partial [Mesorhabditis belari]|uniref:Peptidase metallopeptidase domain-containing protein n=1 Tax=Mesorhabditis belari TaxID=2138241 RepID=A0AAF3E8W4_9BILA
MKIRALILFITCFSLVVFHVSCSRKRSIHRKGRLIWRSRVLTWTFRDPQRLVHNTAHSKAIRDVTRKVFKKWAAILRGRLLFVEVAEDDLDQVEENIMDKRGRNYRKPWWVDIDIVFARGDHGDGEAFDGPGGTVAHSAYPPLGIVHLDADELWTLRENGNRVNLETVLLHEIGHVLGLHHLKDPDSIMNVYYRNLRHGATLSKVDEKAIRKLYHLTNK